MADDSFALSSSLQDIPPAEADYDVLCGAIMASARGRWFLQEYARRNRHSDTGHLLEALVRIEAVIRGDRAALADQDMRLDLLGLARSIARARAEVAEIKPDPSAHGPGSSPSSPPDVLAVTERLQDLVWTLRERGLELAACDEIEAIAKSVLAASALHGPGDPRSGQLGEALRYLEQRIDAMLDAKAIGPGEAGESDVPGGGDDAVAGVRPIPEREPAVERGPDRAMHPQVLEVTADQLLAEPQSDTAALEGEPFQLRAAGRQVPVEDLAFRLDAVLVDAISAVRAPAERASGRNLHPEVATAEGSGIQHEATEASIKVIDAHDDSPIVEIAAVAARVSATELPSPPDTHQPADALPPAPTQQGQAPIAPAANDPLAALSAMSDEERIALFT